MPSDSAILFGQSETVLRLGAFVLAFVLFATLETLLPRRQRHQARLNRWTTNGGMLITANILVRGLSLALPVFAATEAAHLAENFGLGLLDGVTWPPFAEILIAIVLLDLAVWFQHLITHKLPILWRFHRVHHADRDFDASTALRFHPIEIALSALYKFAIVLALGPAVLAVILFEIILNASAMFNHANLALPRWLDTMLRTVFVTPDMHRVHHSVHRDEHDTNYGFCLSVWDRLFQTYTAQPKDGHTNMALGLREQQDAPTQQLRWSLTFPFHRL